jgi:hypothetical protein
MNPDANTQQPGYFIKNIRAACAFGVYRVAFRTQQPRERKQEKRDV